MSRHNHYPKIKPEESKLEGYIIAAACIAVFAFIGVLLAYRG